MNSEYLSIQITANQATSIASHWYNLEGDITPLPGEFDFNFKITTSVDCYLLKVSRPGADIEYIEYQNSILVHLHTSRLVSNSPCVIPNMHGDLTSTIIDENGQTRIVRLLSWVPGRLWSTINPINEELLKSLGEHAGLITSALSDFDHQVAHRDFEWDIAQASWTSKYIHLFSNNQKQIIEYFLDRFDNKAQQYSKLRKSVVHNDVNDNNIIVSEDLTVTKVVSIIDYGDAIHTRTINDLAITIAYAVMTKEDVLDASLPIVAGYHSSFPITENELELLYTLVAMRLIISVTKSAINKQKEPENDYLLISENPAWDVLNKWINIDANFATCSFRNACGYTPHPNYKHFIDWAKKQSFSLLDLFPTVGRNEVLLVDMSVESTWLGHETEYNDSDIMAFKLSQLQSKNPDAIIAGGYLEPRPLYVTDAFKTESNNGSVFRSVHLGIDFWLPAHTPVHALFDGEVEIAVVSTGDKDYGGLIILKHNIDKFSFYTLYGHQSVDSVMDLRKGDIIKRGQKISELGVPEENGNWESHLHFQVMLDMLGNEHDFPGVTYPHKIDVWKSICPDPNILFTNKNLIVNETIEDSKLINYRNRHLGKSLSLPYSKPLRIVRGSGVYLMDNMGRKYLDTVNNVAHVGHEHPRVVEAGRNQMSILNTNTRYLHNNINDFAEELLSTFPDELSVVHFVNSGSEANELALRMAKAVTGQKDIIAVEVGYHGNTSGCIDISSYKFDGKGGNGAPEHTHIVPLPDSFRGMYQGKNTGPKYASHIQDQLDNIHSKDRNIAAFICESIISCGGQIELPEGYLAKAYKLVRQSGGVCIADEVQVGCGRVGSKFWGFQLHNVIPDIVTIGKPIGNGHPLAAVVCTQVVAEAFANGMEYFNTFGGNPVSCAIGLELLRVIKDEDLQKNALEVGGFLKKELYNLQNEFSIIGDVRGQGLFLGFELVDQNKNPFTDKTAYLANRMKDLGILMSVDGKDSNVIKIKPPIIFSLDNAIELIFRLRSVFKEDFMKQ
ncbi:MAG: aminotransferase class III-fold pyridoxal phosphate-dependent enzyme [Bacteroidetes bacterium]|nr:aminotransferase class III-fold pyridoxal phosphate-dependent enzyme [Bacteroidota bacterium]